MPSLRIEKGKDVNAFLKNDNSIMLSASDIFFIIGMICEFVVSFSGFLFGDYNEQLIIIFGMGCFAVKIFLSMDFKKDIIPVAVALLFGLICYKVQNSALILRVMLILIAGKDQNPKSVIRFFFYGTAVVMIAGAVLSALGIHNTFFNIDIYRHADLEKRYTFGFYQPNGFSFFWFRLFAMGLYLYNKKIKWFVYPLIIAVAAVPSILCNSKIGLVIMAMLLLGSIVIRLIGEGKLFKVFYVLGNLYMIAVIGFIYVAMVFFNGYFMPDGDTPAGFWEPLDYYLFNGRLEYARRAFYSNTITLFGHDKGLMTVETGYVSGLFVYGLLFMIIFFIMLFYLFYKMYKRKDKEGMLVILCTVSYCVAESFIGYVNKNLILMLGIGTLMNFYVYFGKKKDEAKSVGCENGKEIRIAFVDFWKDIDPYDNYFTDILKKHYKVVISDTPDYCFCSCFGNDHLKYPDAVKIFFTGENIVPDFNMYDYAMGFSYIDFEDRYLRLPLYALYDGVIEKAQNKHNIPEKELLSKKKACAVVVSNPDAGSLRDKMIEKLSDVMPVASGGRYRNNVGGPVKDKLSFISDYRITFAFENSEHNGYTTEKILEAFAGGTIPVYHGSKDIGREFNPKAFINVDDFPSPEAAADRIKEIAENDEEYLKMMREPMAVPGCQAYDILKEDYAEDFLTNIFAGDKPDTFRRNNDYAGRRYQERRVHAYQLVRVTDIINRPLHACYKKLIQLKTKGNKK